MKLTCDQVAPLVREYCKKEENSNGGSLHIVLVDYNVEDAHVAHCADYAQANDDLEGAMLSLLLLTMTKTQRLKLAHSW